jgi:hypothetical protein
MDMTPADDKLILPVDLERDALLAQPGNLAGAQPSARNALQFGRIKQVCAHGYFASSIV